MIRYVCVLALAAQSAMAAGPVITELKPRGAGIGRPFILTVLKKAFVPVPLATPISEPGGPR